ncbi:MAG: patatin-like phospholipase family protein [Candidatus Omnitrophica bacterium]|nr:patatin-like phospholipase family protein [Candidatus Omnitrophota bacterium]
MRNKLFNIFRKHKRILVLGGGGARGFVSVGVLKSLEKHFGKDIPFDMVIGTSMGSLIGASFCLGKDAATLEKMALEVNWPRLIDLGFNLTGLVKGERMEEIIRSTIDDKLFSEMKIPFALTTTDIETGEELVHTEGDLGKLIRASCSWPGIVSAVNIDGRLLVDGGVRNSIPTKAAKAFDATFILAVDPGFGVDNQKPKNAFKALVQSLQIMGEELNNYQCLAADVVIKPTLKDIHQFDFEKVAIIIRQGEKAADAKIAELKKKLFWN